MTLLLPLLRRAKAPILFVGLLVAVLALQACGGGEGEQPTPTRPEGVGSDEFYVLMRNYAFDPKTLRFNLNETVDFAFTASGEAHTFTVAELGINWVATPTGGIVRQRHTFDRAGTFRLVCVIPGHEGLGMTGTITVE